MMVHIDADCFFAAVEQAADVRLRGRPVAVGGEKRGVIASASYEARKFGVAGAMPTARARKLCPKLIVLPPHFDLYEMFSRRLFSYAHDFTPMVEIGSIDEGYLDVSGCRGLSAHDIAEKLRQAVSQSLRITISEGIGSNKLVSQIASKLRKPAGLVEVERGFETAFLHPLASTWLPGVGPKLGEVLRTAGLGTIGHVARTTADMLSLLAGSLAVQLRAFAQGEDPRPVIPDPPAAKSYGMQETFAEDVTDEAWLVAKLRQMADALLARVRADRKSIRTITLRVRTNDMSECQRSESLAEPADLETDIYPVLPRLLSRAWERRVSVRLLSLRFTQIYHGDLARELPLEGIRVSDARQHRLAAVVDRLRDAGMPLMRGHDLWLKTLGEAPRPALVAGEMKRQAKEQSTNRVLKARPQAAAQLTSPPAFRQGLLTAPLAALNVKSCYSFLDSTLTIPALVEAAAARGFSAIALTDPNLHGAVPFYQAAKAAGLKPILAASLTCAGRPLNAYVENIRGYENLCRLLSFRPGAKVTPQELSCYSEGLILQPPDSLAAPEIRYDKPADRLRYDIVQSIRTLTLLREAHPQKRRGDFHFPEAGEMRSRFTPALLQAAADIAERCTFDFDFSTLRFPRYQPADGSTPREMLRHLAQEGLQRRYGRQARQHQAQIEEELGIIGEVGYEEYFLTVWDLLQECRHRGIEWITRGSAADSLVCYCLEISNVCPIRFDLYFRRFLNRDRMALQKLPDIDIDFAHDKKDEVTQMILDHYGPEHSAIVGGFNTFQARSAVAEIAKVLGVSDRDIRTLTTKPPHSRAEWLPEAIAANHLAADFPIHEEPYRTAIATAAFLDGFPRYAKMHPCGVVVSRDPIHHFTPTFLSQKGWPTTHFDMDACEAVGLIKLDILAQGGLAVIRDTKSLLAERGITLKLEHLEPWADPAIWDMIATGQSRGVHHIESPAMGTLARMAAVRDIDRLIAIVSVIRPGAANNLKKVQFSRRAQGLEPVEYAHPSLEPVLRSTFGVIAYEEHILQVCEAFAGLNPGRADVLRRALVKSDRRKIDEIGTEFVESARRLDRSEESIREVWALVAGFEGYAFCRAHSTAYGVEAYQGALLKHYHAPEFLACVLSNGKGFYSPLAYTLECRRLGIEFRLPCLNASRPEFFVEYAEHGAPCIRVPLHSIKGLSSALLARWTDERRKSPFASLEDFVQRTSPTPEEMLLLIRAGAFDSFGHSRPEQFWQARQLVRWSGEAGTLFPATTDTSGLPCELATPEPLQKLRDEMELLGFTISGHPLDLHPEVAWDTYCPISSLSNYRGQTVTVCGLIIEERLHRQLNGEIMKFLTLCDRTGFVECELFAASYKAHGLATIRWPVVEITGQVTVFETTPGQTLTVERAAKPRIGPKPPSS